MVVGELFNHALDQVLANPVLLVTALTGFVGVLYYFGSIMTANSWQYQNMKEGRNAKIYQGLHFLTSFVLLPALIVGWVVTIWPWLQGVLQSGAPWMYVLLLIALYMVLEGLDKRMRAAAASFADGSFILFGAKIANFGDFKHIFWLANIGMLMINPPAWAIVALLWLDVLVLSKWARLVTLHQQGAVVKIKLRNRKNKFVARLIEFVGDDRFLKLQLKNPRKGQGSVQAIATGEIEFIELVQDQPSITPVADYVLRKIFRWKIFEEEIDRQMKVLKEKNIKVR